MELKAEDVINRLAGRLAQAHADLAVAEARAEAAEQRVSELEDNIREGGQQDT